MLVFEPQKITALHLSQAESEAIGDQLSTFLRRKGTIANWYCMEALTGWSRYYFFSVSHDYFHGTIDAEIRQIKEPSEACLPWKFRFSP